MSRVRVSLGKNPFILKEVLPYDPTIPLLGIHTEENRSERDTCTPMFIAALFMIARTWKQPRCPSAEKWMIICVFHIHNGILLRHSKEFI